MIEVQYHRNAARSLRRLPVDRKEQIKGAIADLAALDSPENHGNVRQMSGDWAGCYRLRLGSYRVVFCLAVVDEKDVLQVLQVGPRGSVY